MARGQAGSLFLTCVISSITAPRRFIPTLSLSICLPPLSELTRVSPSQLRLLRPGFRRVDHSHRRRIYLRWQLGKFHRRVSHPLEHQLASLHPYGGFSPVRLQGRNFRRSLPSTLVCHRLSCSLLPSEFPALCQGRCAYKHLRASGQAALPQGPSLRSGLFCPGPSTLIRPHPPHSRAHPDFTVSRLIRDAFAVHIRICLPKSPVSEVS